MISLSLAFLVGISAFQFCSALPEPAWLWLLVLCLLIFSRYHGLRLLAIAIAGFVWAWLNAWQLLQLELPKPLEGQDVLVQGQIQGLPESTAEGSLRFRFLIDEYQSAGAWKPLSLPVRLTWYRTSVSLHPGERWQLRVKMKRPHGFANPGGFDYERWLFAHRIRATGYVRGKDGHQLLEPGKQGIEQLRQYLSIELAARGQEKTRGLLAALAVGDRSNLQTEQWQVLQRTGTGHLVAISGLHVGLVAALMFFLSRTLWSRFGAAERWPAPRVAAVVSMLAALAYALLAGFQIPTQRAVIMVWAWMIALLYSGRPGVWQVWSFALWLVLLLDPAGVLTAGFWLSFGAVACLLMLSSMRVGQDSRWQRMVGLQWSLVIGLTPLLWLWFGQISLIAPVANLIAIPWISFLVVPVLLLALICLPWLPALAEALLSLTEMSLAILWRLLETLASLPWALSPLPEIDNLWVVLLFLGIACWLLPKALSLRFAALALIAPIFLLQVDKPARGQIRLTLLDVGQGLAVVVETHSRVLVFDTGPAFRSGFNTGAAVVVPYLRQRGIQRVDRLIISHADNDHIGGGQSVFRELEVMKIDSGEPARIHWARSSHCVAGDRWELDGVAFEYLAPAMGAQRSGNDASCVLRIQTADQRVVLLTGDIEKSAEKELLSQKKNLLNADILIAPHHGSKTSSGKWFIAAVDPRFTLFSAGYLNRFGHPKAAVMRRYQQQGSILLNTGDSGAIQFLTEPEKALQPVRYRIQTRHYWAS